MGERGKSGIYSITNSVSGKVYVGQAASIGDRWLTHRSHLACGRHANRYLQRAFDKSGAEAFVFAVLEYVEVDRDALSRAEQAWVDRLKPAYNLAPVAGSSLGLKHPPRSEEFRKRMGDMKRGFKHKPETIERLREIAAKQDYHPTPQHIEKMRAFMTGRRHSQETIEKTRLANLGRKQSADEIARRSASNTGRKRTAEQRARISAAKTGHGLGSKQSAETIEKKAAALRGRRRPDVAAALSRRRRPAHVLAALAAANEARYAERVARIREAIASDPQASAASIARSIGVNRDTVRKYKVMNNYGGINNAGR